MGHLLAGTLDDAGYRRLLLAQLGLFEAWEGERAGWLAQVASRWAYRSRGMALRADLVGAPAADEGAPSPAGSPAADATCWGELYVVEGSALGGRLIVRILRNTLPDLPHHFYALGESGPSWHRFQDLLDAHLPDASARQVAVDGALAMFARFQHSLQDDAAHV